MFFSKKKKTTKFIDSKDYVICSKCGKPIKTKDRYCLKCGALNLDHPENQYLRKYMSFKNIEKKNRQEFEEHTEQKVDDVYVGGKKLEKEYITESNEVKKEPQEETYREVIRIPLSLIVLLLLIIGFLVYYFIIK